MRDLILREIRRIADQNGGRPPGFALFNKETGIGESQWRGKFWARWGDALIEAGYEPNQWTGRLEPADILKALIDACRHYGRFPTVAEIRMYRRSNSALPNASTIRTHFKDRAGMIAALAGFVEEKDDHADIRAMLPTEIPVSRDNTESVGQRKSADGYVYLIQSGDFYKIGRSDDIERRFKQISVAMPDKATLVHTIRTDDPPGIEAYWHRRFAEKRANGEWFKLTSQDVAAFIKRKYQ